MLGTNLSTGNYSSVVLPGDESSTPEPENHSKWHFFPKTSNLWRLATESSPFCLCGTHSRQAYYYPHFTDEGTGSGQVSNAPGVTELASDERQYLKLGDVL